MDTGLAVRLARSLLVAIDSSFGDMRSAAVRQGRMLAICVSWREAVSSTVMPLDLIEFPADDLARARRFWETLLDVSLDERREGEGQGLQTHDDRASLGLHDRGRGPGDRFSLPYFRVPDLARALERVVELEGSVVHPGERWAICRDSEGSPFGLAAE
jgi:predicted enzyme related to lactoylglutathione lyase